MNSYLLLQIGFYAKHARVNRLKVAIPRMSRILHAPSIRRGLRRRILPEQMMERRDGLQRVLEACVTIPDRNIMIELECNGVEVAQNLAYLHSRVADNIRTLARVPKMKLHNLVELLVKDLTVNLSDINAISIQCRLDRVNRMCKDVQAKKGSDEELVKYAVKLLLPKFNGCIVDWPA